MKNIPRVKVLLIGSGSLGLYFTSALARAGAETAVVARSDYDAVKRSSCYRIHDRGKEYTFTPDHLLQTVQECPFEPDYVLFCTKVLPSADPLELLKGILRTPRTVLVLIQNGIGIEERIFQAFPETPVLSAVAYLCASRPEKGMVYNTGPGKLEMGYYPAEKPDEKAQKLQQLFEAGNASCLLMENVQEARWKKLLWNIPYNLVSVLAGGATTFEMSHDPHLVKLCRDLMEEVIRIAASCSVTLTDEDASRMETYTATLGNYKSSMLQDYEANRPLEVEAIAGNCLRTAYKNNIPAPKLESCYALLRSLDELRFRS